MRLPFGKAVAAGSHPEAQLLLCCARTSVDAECAERIKRVVQRDLDWPSVIRTAHAHGVMPLLYQSLQTTCPASVPKPAMDQLQAQFRANARRNAVLTRELLALLHLLETHGIAAVPFKGPILATSIYGDLSLRQFQDLDILVHPHDLLPAKDVLVSQGYRPWRHLTPAQEVVHLQTHHAYAFVHKNAKFAVDLHWRITPRFIPLALDPDRLWERLKPLSLSGMRVLNLSPADLLLILCLHGSKHCWERLAWVCDVAELIRVQHDMDWEQIIAQASGLGGLRMLFLGLLVASDLLGAALPREVLQRVQADSRVKSLATRVHEWLFSEVDGPLKVIATIAFRLSMRERLQDRVPYFIHRLRLAITPNAKDRAFLSLPAPLFPLYYLVRPIRLTATYGLRPLRRASDRNQGR